MWVTYERDQYLHFANTTNNRLESHNQKPKDLTSKSSCLSELFEKVLLYSRSAALSTHINHSLKSLLPTEFDVSNSSEIQRIQAVCTQYASALILEQLMLSKSMHPLSH